MGIAHYTYTATALVVCIFMLSCIKVESSGIFQLDLLSYTNPDGRDISGGCCSGRHRADESNCQGNCSVYLRFCLKHYEANVDLKGKCTFTEYVTPILVLENSTTSLEILDLQDHFKMSVDLGFTWPGEFTLIVEAWHPSEKGNSKILVSQFTAQRTLEVGFEWTQDKLTSEYSSLDLKYRVICAEDYYGPKCKTLCRPRDDKFGHYNCGEDGTRICISGWSGEYCASAVCATGCHNGTCNNKPGECNCRYGWEGSLCDQCKTYPGCVHGGCKKPWTCICDEGWGGVLCDKDLNYCTNHKPCQNGGTCTNTGQGSYTCACSEDYMGENCDILKNPCLGKPCLNNGHCQNPSVGEYTCTCQLGFFGPHCETSASICTEGLCKNGGTCIQDPDGFVCSCLPGFDGILCERAISCETSHCLNGGTCIISGNSFHCLCSEGVSGDRCEIVHTCSLNLCKNGGTCIENSGTVICRCPLGYSGTHCHLKKFKCSPDICANEGTCHALVNGYRCACKPGFTGKNCTVIQNDDCSSSPCLNGASCHANNLGGYTCQCLQGYKGNRCQLRREVLVSDWYESPSVASNVSHRVSEKEEEVSVASQIYLVIGLSVSFIMLIILSVCVLIGYRRRRSLLKPEEQPKRYKDSDFDIENEQAQNERNAIYMNNKHCDMPQKIVNELDRVPIRIPNEAPPKVLNSEISNKRIPDKVCTQRTLQQKIDNTCGNSTGCHFQPERSPCSSKPIYTIEDHLRPCPEKELYLNMGESLGTDV